MGVNSSIKTNSMKKPSARRLPSSGGDVIQRLRADIAQPEQNEYPQQPAKVERAERECEQYRQKA